MEGDSANYLKLVLWKPPIWPWSRVLPSRCKGWDAICLGTEEPIRCALISFLGKLSEDEDKSLYITTMTLSSTTVLIITWELNVVFFFLRFFLFFHFAEGIYRLTLHFETERIVCKVSPFPSDQRFSPSIMTVLTHHTHSIHITLHGLGSWHRLIVIFALCTWT